MPTDPFEGILNRDLVRVVALPITEVASPLLVELVNHATWALARCCSTKPTIEDDNLAPMSLYRHVIEMGDGVEVLVSQSCAVPAIPLIRSGFEALLSLRYILEGDYSRRSLSWLARHGRERLHGYERLDPATARGKQLEGIKVHDTVAGKIAFPSAEVARQGQARMRRILSRPAMHEIEEEVRRLKKEKGNEPRWYGLFGGPSNLRELARRLDSEVQYEFLYQHWSGTVHATGFERFIQKGTRRGGQSAVTRLRDSEELQQVAFYAAHQLLTATRIMLERFREGDEDFRGWYLREVRERYLWLVGKPGSDESMP